MKTPFACILRICAVIVTLVSLCSEAAGAADIPEDFPYVIRVEMGDKEFVPGDSIEIQEVRGTKATITKGGTYRVKGTYTLNSKETASLGLFVTTTNNVSYEYDSRQVADVKKGTGSFTLIMTMAEYGYPHVSLYPLPSGSAFGGIYFGQGEGVLRKKGFSYLDKKNEARNGNPTSEPVKFSGANRVLFEYLGNPVEPPPNMDANYTKEGLVNAVRLAARNAGITLKRVDIDESEYPFLVGITCNEGDFPKLMEQIKKLKDYEDHGSVGYRDLFTINIVPYRAYPSEVMQRISRRVTLRQQIFYDRLFKATVE